MSWACPLGQPGGGGCSPQCVHQPDPPYLQVADDTIGLWFVQSACRGHRELLSSTDKKVASGRVAAAFCTAIAELWFLSTHSGTTQGYRREKRQPTTLEGKEESKRQVRGTHTHTHPRRADRKDSEERRIQRKTQRANERWRRQDMQRRERKEKQSAEHIT